MAKFNAMDGKDNSFLPLTEEQKDILYIDGMTELGGPTPTTDVKSSPTTETSKDSKSSIFGKWTFPWLLSVSVVQLGIYMNKLYQDSAAVAVYYDARDLNYCVVSAACLFIPAIIYIVFIVSLYVKQQEKTERKEVGTKVVHGLLLVPWQIKGRVEVLHFSAQRVCQRRLPTPEESMEKSTLQRQAAVLEFFEEFYAGFLQLLLQLYIIILSLDKTASSGSKVLPGEIIASALTLMSMMVAVRRKDDGILTGILSVTGWLCMMISRTVAMALATTVIHSAMLLVCLIHGTVVSVWLSSVAIKSCWQSESSLSVKRKIALFFVIFTVFGLPSLTYWPIMFQMKDRKRPYIFLFVMFVENGLFLAMWFLLRDAPMAGHHTTLIGVIIGTFVVGALFICFYICCKPKYTDQVVYHDMKIQNAESFGMYFDFCDLVFSLPRQESLEVKLDKVRKAGQHIP